MKTRRLTVPALALALLSLPVWATNGGVNADAMAIMSILKEEEVSCVFISRVWLVDSPRGYFEVTVTVNGEEKFRDFQWLPASPPMLPNFIDSWTFQLESGVNTIVFAGRPWAEGYGEHPSQFHFRLEETVETP